MVGGLLVHVLSETEAEELISFATAISSLLSALKSATATENGKSPVPKSLLAPNAPDPSPKRIDTELTPEFAVARSRLVSPLKSPTATEVGPAPVPKSVFAPNKPVPVPRRIDTLLLL